MLIGIVTSVSILTLAIPSVAHFVSLQETCYLAFTCNHTGNTECGMDKNRLHTRMFLDECDRMEHNCDFNTEYVKIDMSECSSITKHTQTSSTNASSSKTINSTTKSSTTYINDTTTEKATKATEFTSSLITPLNITSTTELATKPIDIKESVLVETTVATTAANISTEIQKGSISSTTCTRAKNRHTYFDGAENVTKPMSTAEETTNPTILETSTSTNSTAPYTSTENSTTTVAKPTEGSITIETSITTDAVNTTKSKATTVSDITTEPSTITKANITESGTTTEAGVNTKAEDTTPKETAISVTTTQSKATLTTKSNATEVINTQSINTTEVRTTVSKPVLNVTAVTNSCNMTTYPENCKRPATWETTSEGERRDYFQILKERFGRRAMVMKHTTHFPQGIGLYKNRRKDTAFMFGNHIEKHY